MELNLSQRKLLAGFFTNMSVVWFGAAFITPADLIAVGRSLISAIISISIGIWLVKEVYT